MASPFKKVVADKPSTQTPEELFAELRRDPTIKGLLSQQADVLRDYVAKFVSVKDIALELPTGAGKTLVGLLTAEWRRKTKGERAIYLCPTRQLCNQVADKAKQYGIDCVTFVGSKSAFEPKDVQDYNSGKKVAIAPYSRIFNVSPGIAEPNFIVLDDAHSAEQYIAGMWSLTVDGENKDLREGLLGVLKGFLSPTFVERLGAEGTPVQARSIEMVPSDKHANATKSVREFLDSVGKEGLKDLVFPWETIREHLSGCNIFVTRNEVLIRPYVPPSLTHKHFSTANQRFFLSATIGPLGSLERMTGVPSITRMPTPPLMKGGGTGRRFFLFPAANSQSGEALKWAFLQAQKAGRALVVCRDHSTALAVGRTLANEFKMKILGARDVEASLSTFTKATNTALVVATRFDGLDLPEDTCRVTILVGTPSAVNLQEKFMLTRLGMGHVLRDRVVTRFMQASGRCTRGETDYSLVVPTGQDLLDFCSRKENRSAMHNVLAAEVDFGLEQSSGSSLSDLDAMAEAFFDQNADWKDVDAQIRGLVKADGPVDDADVALVMKNAKREVEFSYMLWGGPDYQKAGEIAREIADTATSQELSLYRAWWAYQANQCYLQLYKVSKDPQHLALAEKFGNVARGAAGLASWYSHLPHFGPKDHDIGPDDEVTVGAQVENYVGLLQKWGIRGPRFEAEIASVRARLSSDKSAQFEEGLAALGDCLGWDGTHPNVAGAPDSIWKLTGSPCLVFEAKSEKEQKNAVSKADCTQAQGHFGWMKQHHEIQKTNCRVVITSANPSIHDGARPHVDDLRYCPLSELLKVLDEAAEMLRTVRNGVSEVDTPLVRQLLEKSIRSAKLSPSDIIERIGGRAVSKLPVSVAG